MWCCPDGGYCHHECVRACYRVLNCGPLSDNSYPEDQWPADLLEAHQRAVGLEVIRSDSWRLRSDFDVLPHSEQES